MHLTKNIKYGKVGEVVGAVIFNLYEEKSMKNQNDYIAKNSDSKTSNVAQQHSGDEQVSRSYVVCGDGTVEFGMSGGQFQKHEHEYFH